MTEVETETSRSVEKTETREVNYFNARRDPSFTRREFGRINGFPLEDSLDRDFGKEGDASWDSLLFHQELGTVEDNREVLLYSVENCLQRMLATCKLKANKNRQRAELEPHELELVQRHEARAKKHQSTSQKVNTLLKSELDEMLEWVKKCKKAEKSAARKNSEGSGKIAGTSSSSSSIAPGNSAEKVVEEAYELDEEMMEWWKECSQGDGTTVGLGKFIHEKSEIESELLHIKAASFDEYLARARKTDRGVQIEQKQYWEERLQQLTAEWNFIKDLPKPVVSDGASRSPDDEEGEDGVIVDSFGRLFPASRFHEKRHERESSSYGLQRERSRNLRIRILRARPALHRLLVRVLRVLPRLLRLLRLHHLFPLEKRRNEERREKRGKRRKAVADRMVVPRLRGEEVPHRPKLLPHRLTSSKGWKKSDTRLWLVLRRRLPVA